MFWSRRRSVGEYICEVYMKKSLVSPSFIKQRARQLKRKKSLSQSLALDEAAREAGHTNYKNYLNLLTVNRKQSELSKSSHFENLYSEKDVSKKISLAMALVQKFKTSYQDLLAILDQIQHSDEAVQSLCEKSTLKDDAQTSLLQYFPESKDDVQALPLMEHFVAKKVSVKDLTYEFDSDKIRINGNYDIGFEFEYDVPQEMKHQSHFNRDPMFGDFEMTMDKNKKISIENPSIGDFFEGRLYMSSFKLGHPK